ncbi:hypothetical protein Tco_0458114 [Tanacetum coccineum]
MQAKREKQREESSKASFRASKLELSAVSYCQIKAAEQCRALQQSKKQQASGIAAKQAAAGIRMIEAMSRRAAKQREAEQELSNSRAA